MAKWIIPIIIMLCMCFAAESRTLIQVSTDNSTWQDINSTYYGGVIDDENKRAYSLLLDGEEIHYFRARNETNSWYYISDRTSEFGGKSEMILGLFLFLMLINGVTFAIPFWVNFSKNDIANLLIRRFIFIASFLFAWLNITLARTLAQTYNIGIDDFLSIYWWIFTWGVLVCIFLIVFFSTVTLLDLIKKAKIRTRIETHRPREYETE